MTGVRALLLPALFLAACATGGREEDRALVEAGRLVRHAQPPPTAPELRLEVDSFLDNELPLLKRKVDLRLETEVKTWRAIAIGGAALGVLAATSGTIGSNGAAGPALTGIGVVAALGGWATYAVRTKPLRECQAFLDAARGDVASWRQNAIPPGEGSVSPTVWHAWIDRVAAIRGHESCRTVR